jgi:hypothetical protein
MQRRGSISLFLLRFTLIGITCLPLFLWVGSHPVCASAQIVMNTPETSFKRETFRERDGAIRSEYKYVLPLSESPGANQGDQLSGRLSLHLDAWSREHQTGNDLHQSKMQGALNCGYLKYDGARGQLSLNLGRQWVKDGVDNTRLDGLTLSRHWGSGFSTAFFAGLPPTFADPNGGREGFIYGGRVAHNRDGLYQVGLSYQSKENGDVKTAAFLAFNWGDRFALNGLSGRNLAGRPWHEHSYTARLKFNDFQVDPVYQQFQYRNRSDRYRGDASHLRFITNENEIVEIAGSDILWRGSGPVKPGVRGRRYHYDLRKETSNYYAGILAIDTAAGSRFGFEAGRMEGETPENNYKLYKGSFYWKNPIHLNGFLSANTRYTVYDERVTGKDHALELSLGAGRGFWNGKLEGKLTATYCRDPFAGETMGALMSFTVRL